MKVAMVGSSSMTSVRTGVATTRSIDQTPFHSAAMKGYRKSRGGERFSFTLRALTQRSRFIFDPALSFVPDALPPPNGCWPTTAPVGLSLM